MRCVLCFLDPERAREFELAGPDLEDAIAEVRALVARERAEPSELPPPTLVDA